MADLAKKLSWDDLRIVKAIGEAGTLARAAAAMGANPSTVFRRLAQVEQLLGLRLFERRRDGYGATAIGAEVIALAQRMETDIVGLTNRISGLKQDVSGELRITASDSLAFHLVTPIVGEFLSVYPNVRFHMCIGNTAANLARGETDVAIRATQKPPENMVGRKVAVIAWAAYGRRIEFVNRSGAVGELKDRRWVSYSDELADLKAARFLSARVEASHISYRANSVQGVAAAIGAGLGIGYLPCMLGDLIPSLMRIEPIDASLADELWLLTHPELKRSRRVRVFIDFFAAAVDRQRAFIAGIGDIEHRASGE
ncbi:MAG TPA: LysR family transcriptional regulator [Steroidobacter sp.]|uniref:LysR family transcriptional regulator n=1 Tax=Steroidobacter sp. TaxID=1978227 RepID=UPI002EDA1079